MDTMEMKMTAAEETMMAALNGKGTQTSFSNKTGKATDNQIATAKKIAEQKNQIFDESRTDTFDSCSAYIGELINAASHKGASEKQIDKIKEYCDALGRTYPDFSKLEGGMDGTASQLIQLMKKKVDILPVPLSDKQADFIAQMQYCPDCPVIESIATMLKTDATDYITKHRNDYYSWIKTRLSTEQINRIKQLCGMMETTFEFSSIIQLDTISASAYIIQLESEYKAKEWQKTTLEAEEMRGIHTIDDAETKDTARLELRSFVCKLYACMGQEIEEDQFETITFSVLKDLVDEAKIWGGDIKGMMDGMTVLSTAQMDFLAA